MGPALKSKVSTNCTEFELSMPQNEVLKMKYKLTKTQDVTHVAQHMYIYKHAPHAMMIIH
jgi:hypothetical protein